MGHRAAASVSRDHWQPTLGLTNVRLDLIKHPTSLVCKFVGAFYDRIAHDFLDELNGGGGRLGCPAPLEIIERAGQNVADVVGIENPFWPSI